MCNTVSCHVAIALNMVRLCNADSARANSVRRCFMRYSQVCQLSSACTSTRWTTRRAIWRFRRIRRKFARQPPRAAVSVWFLIRVMAARSTPRLRFVSLHALAHEENAKDRLRFIMCRSARSIRARRARLARRFSFFLSMLSSQASNDCAMPRFVMRASAAPSTARRRRASKTTSSQAFHARCAARSRIRDSTRMAFCFSMARAAICACHCAKARRARRLRIRAIARRIVLARALRSATAPRQRSRAFAACSWAMRAAARPKDERPRRDNRTSSFHASITARRRRRRRSLLRWRARLASIATPRRQALTACVSSEDSSRTMARFSSVACSPWLASIAAALACPVCPIVFAV